MGPLEGGDKRLIRQFEGRTSSLEAIRRWGQDLTRPLEGGGKMLMDHSG